MNLFERYVQAVKTYLPEKLRENVGEELLSLPNEKVEDVRDEHEGNVPEETLADILKRQGHPMTAPPTIKNPMSL